MVKSIDSNVMIHRSAEYGRQLAERMNAADHAKEFAQQVEKQKALHEDQSVKETQHAEEKAVRREKEKQEDNRDESSPQEKNDAQDEIADELKIAPSEVLGKGIDISI